MSSAVAGELAYWRDEVASLRRAASELPPAASAAVTAVLRSLQHDPTSDVETRADAQTLLEALHEPIQARRTREFVARIGQRLAAELAA